MIIDYYSEGGQGSVVINYPDIYIYIYILVGDLEHFYFPNSWDDDPI